MKIKTKSIVEVEIKIHQIKTGTSVQKKFKCFLWPKNCALK